MNERHKADAQLQSAALRHYAVMCREKARNMVLIEDNDSVTKAQLEGFAERADKLAATYDKLAAS